MSATGAMWDAELARKIKSSIKITARRYGLLNT